MNNIFPVCRNRMKDRIISVIRSQEFYSYKDLWKYFQIISEGLGLKYTESSFRQLLKVLIDVHVFDCGQYPENNLERDSYIEGYFKCELCGFNIPLEGFVHHVQTNHNWKYVDYVKKFGRVVIPKM